MNLADAAIKLGSDTLVMSSYWNMQTEKQSWFFSPNPDLKSATKRPSVFTSWGDWDKASSNQKKTLATMAGFKQDATNVIRRDADLIKLKSAYSKWRSDLFSVFWGKQYTCNIFVGDAIFLAYGRMVNAINVNGHYYDPNQIRSCIGPFKKRSKIEDVKLGDIVVMLDGHHVEIITKIQNYTFADKGFCSCGAGRAYEDEMGTEKCDSSFTLSETRELENYQNTFYYI